MIEESFEDLDYCLRVTRELQSLRQTTSVANYAIEFKAIASNLSWNDEALCSRFYEELKDIVKDEISKNPPDTLRAFIALAIRIDNRQAEREKRFRKNATVESRTTIIEVPSPSSSQQKLDANERARRQALKLCYYCDDFDHVRSSCPKLSSFTVNSMSSFSVHPYVPSLTMSASSDLRRLQEQAE